MSAALGLSQLVLLAAFLFGAIGSLVVWSARRIALRSIATLGPRTRADVISAILALPLLLALVVPLLCLLPSAAAMIAPSVDHCAHHHDDHAHLCLAHPPSGAGSASGWVLLALGAATLAVGGGAIARRARADERVIGALQSIAKPAAGVLTIATHEPLCFTTGLIAPRVLVSTGLLDGLDAASLEVALAHERAHVRRRDPLRKLLAHLLGALHAPAARRELLRALDLACEQACDDEAARAIEDRLGVARALVVVARRVERAFTTPTVLGSGAAVAHVEARVAALLSDPLPEVAWSWWWALACAAILPLSFLLHHVTESLLAFLVR